MKDTLTIYCFPYVPMINECRATGLRWTTQLCQGLCPPSCAARGTSSLETCLRSIIFTAGQSSTMTHVTKVNMQTIQNTLLLQDKCGSNVTVILIWWSIGVSFNIFRVFTSSGVYFDYFNDTSSTFMNGVTIFH